MGRKRGLPHRSKLKVARDRVEIARRYLAGEYQANIGKSLGLTQQTISNELAAIKKVWLTSSLRDFDEAKSTELAKLALLEQTYWDTGEKSEKARSRQTQVIRPGADNDGRPGTQLLTVHIEDTVGDKKWLEGIQRCIDQRCAINGLIAPTKIAASPDSKGSAPLAVVGVYSPEKTPHL